MTAAPIVTAPPVSKQTMLLALETAQDFCSVALYNADGVQAFDINLQPREQTRQLLPMIDALLKSAQVGLGDVCGIAFSRGPATFSGIRINAAVTQALAWAHDLPVFPISTLQATSQAALDSLSCSQSPLPSVILASIDARMNELYSGLFKPDTNGIMQPLRPEALTGYDAALLYEDLNRYPDMHAVGSGTSLLLPYCSVRPAHTLETVLPDARHIAKLAYLQYIDGLRLPAHEALPVYLREHAWKKIGEQGRSTKQC